jgi:N-acetyl-gamma-glutamyl-phosphate reductase
MVPKIFIDGSAGTTGLVIAQLLQPLINSGKIELISIANRRSDTERRVAYEQADLTVLCLPDEEAKRAMELMRGTKTRVLDASSAHRTEEGWVYGLPELDTAQPGLIHDAKYVSNPGCFATGAVVLLHPLIEAGLLDKNACVPLVGTAGYSAGGKASIARHAEAKNPGDVFNAVSLDVPHKHVPEIQKHSGLETPPLFMPHVVGVPRGMMISAVFNRAALKGGLAQVKAAYEKAYKGAAVIKVHEEAPKRLDFSRFNELNKKDSRALPQETLDIYVTGWEDAKGTGEIRVTALLDNLGKGAGTQAVQNIKLMLNI